jgi:hypothetical protein
LSFIYACYWSISDLRLLRLLAHGSTCDIIMWLQVIRLVAIATSPAYSASLPALDLYYRTTAEQLPLPPLGVLLNADKLDYLLFCDDIWSLYIRAIFL